MYYYLYHCLEKSKVCIFAAFYFILYKMVLHCMKANTLYSKSNFEFNIFRLIPNLNG